MKKSPLFPLMGFLPLVMGFFYIRTAAFPLLGTLFFTALPWVMVALWVRAGWRCGAAGRGWLRSAIVAHWSVLLVAACAVWQFALIPDERRSLALSVFAQYLFGLVPGVVRLVVPLIEWNNTISSGPLIALGTPMSALALLLLFSLGYSLGWRSRQLPRLRRDSVTHTHILHSFTSGTRPRVPLFCFAFSPDCGKLSLRGKQFQFS